MDEGSGMLVSVLVETSCCSTWVFCCWEDAINEKKDKGNLEELEVVKEEEDKQWRLELTKGRKSEEWERLIHFYTMSKYNSKFKLFLAEDMIELTQLMGIGTYRPISAIMLALVGVKIAPMIERALQDI